MHKQSNEGIFSKPCLHVLASPNFGGAEKLALQMHTSLRARSDANVSIAAPIGGTTAEVLDRSSIPFRPFNESSLFSNNPAVSFREGIRILGREMLFKAGVIHIHSPFMYGALRRTLAFSKAKPVLHIHADYGTNALTWPLRHPPRLVIICAEYLRTAVLCAMPAPHNSSVTVYTLRNVIDSTRFSPGSREIARRACGLPTEGVLIAHVANLAETKGQKTSIRTIAEVLKAGIDAQLLIIGESRSSDTSYRSELIELCDRLGVRQKVQFLGLRSDVPSLLRSAEFNVLPSATEGLPLSILEAKASGSVVVAAPVGGIPEIINDGVDGFLVPAEDHIAYARCIATLATNSSTYERVRERALASARVSPTMDQYCAQLTELYATL